jgi:hypothetical protein
VALCLLFLVWFASGAVLAFVPFPALADGDRLARADVLRLQDVKITPAAALKVAGGGDRLTLLTAGGETVYVVGAGKSPLVSVDAVTGEKSPALTAAKAASAASAFAGVPPGSVAGPLMYDQWIVHQNFDPWRPFYRVTLKDGASTQLYISARTGEVVQRTRGDERAWNWAGAVTHWLYFTAIRKSFALWDQSVWWVSLVGLSTAIAGTWLGIIRTLRRMQGRRPDWSPFRGWLRWHHGIGLGVAGFVLTWIFSGWLSMDHGRLFSRGTPGPTAQMRYDGAPLDFALSKESPGALAALGPARRITFSVVGGHAIAAAEGGPSGPKIVLLDTPGAGAASQIPTAVLTDAAAKGWPLSDKNPRGPDARDALYRLAEGLPPRAISLPLAKPEGASVYLDPITGRVLTVLDSSRKAYAWVYFAVHTFNFPVLIDRPILRRTLEMIPLFFGFAFSLTGLVIAIKRLRISVTH